jgi:hypothetical protein
MGRQTSVLPQRTAPWDLSRWETTATTCLGKTEFEDGGDYLADEANKLEAAHSTADAEKINGYRDFAADQTAGTAKFTSRRKRRHNHVLFDYLTLYAPILLA